MNLAVSSHNGNIGSSEFLVFVNGSFLRNSKFQPFDMFPWSFFPSYFLQVPCPTYLALPIGAFTTFYLHSILTLIIINNEILFFIFLKKDECSF